MNEGSLRARPTGAGYFGSSRWKPLNPGNAAHPNAHCVRPSHRHTQPKGTPMPDINYNGLNLHPARLALIDEGITAAKANDLMHFSINVQYGREGKGSSAYTILCKHAPTCANVITALIATSPDRGINKIDWLSPLGKLIHSWSI